MDNALPRRWAAGIRGLAIVVALTMVLAVLIYPWLHAYLVAWVAPWLGTIGAVGGLAAAAALVFWRRSGRWLVGQIMRPRQRTFLWVVCTTSFALRWVILRVVHAMPGQPAPDVYGSWVFYEKSAIYPPGHRFLMTAVHFVMGHSHAAVVLFICAMVVAVTLMVYRLARQAYGEPVARLSAVAIAFMPSWLLYGNLEYDLVLGFFEVLLVFLFFARRPERHTAPWLILYGLILGFTCLVKPIAVIFPGIILLIYLGRRLRFRSALAKSALIAVFMFVAIVPWTIRNRVVIGRFVLLSTNLGVILHTANNPDADGLEMMMKPTAEMTDEVEMNRLRIRMAMRYIKDHPGHFLQLMGYRIVWTWGSDCGFVSTTLHDRVSGGVMNLVRGVLQLPYILAVGLLGIGLLKYRRDMIRTVLHAVLFAPIAYVWALHLLCQTHPQHHLPALPFLLVFAAFVLVRAAGVPAAEAASGRGFVHVAQPSRRPE